MNATRYTTHGTRWHKARIAGVRCCFTERATSDRVERACGVWRLTRQKASLLKKSRNHGRGIALRTMTAAGITAITDEEVMMDDPVEGHVQTRYPWRSIVECRGPATGLAGRRARLIGN